MISLQQLPGMTLPIVQAPMAGVQASALAIAASEAEGLGSLPCAMLGREAMRDELKTSRAQTGVPRLMQELGPPRARAPVFPPAAAAQAPLRATAESLERGEFSPLWSGPNASGCKEVPAAVLTRELAGAC